MRRVALRQSWWLSPHAAATEPAAQVGGASAHGRSERPQVQPGAARVGNPPIQPDSLNGLRKQQNRWGNSPNTQQGCGAPPPCHAGVNNITCGKQPAPPRANRARGPGPPRRMGGAAAGSAGEGGPAPPPKPPVAVRRPAGGGGGGGARRWGRGRPAQSACAPPQPDEGVCAACEAGSSPSGTPHFSTPDSRVARCSAGAAEAESCTSSL